MLFTFAFGWNPARAYEERHIEFVHKLQEQGFADLAIEYLNALRDRDGLPDEVREVLDYEIGKTMVLQSEETDPETERKLLEEAAQLLRRFLENHPDSSEANHAVSELAGVLLKQGQQMLGKAEAEKDAGRKLQLRGSARKMFEEVQTNLSGAIEKYREELQASAEAAKADEKTKTPKGKSTAKKSTRPRSKTGKTAEKDPRVEGAYIIARLNLGIAQYFVGRSYDATADADKAAKKAQFDKAIQTFDDLFQEYRGSFASFIAHLWHGRSLEELGDFRQALMLYDEVLVNEPPVGERIPREQAALFTQAEVFRLSALNRQEKHSEVVPEAQLWLRQHADKRRTAHGLGIQLQLAKAQIALGQKMPAGSGERRQVFAQALQLLNNDVAKFPSPYQNEAFRLRQEHIGEVTAAGGKIASFDEGTFIADAALAKEDWAAAATAYEQAIALANDKTDAEELDAAAYRWSFASLRAGNATDAAARAEKLAREKPLSRWAPDSAAIAVVAHSSSYASAQNPQQRDAAQKQLAALTQFMEEKWPEHSQTDVARRTIGSILLYMRDFAGAAEMLQRIGRNSNFFADAQTKIAQAYWSLYLQELGKTETERDSAAMTRWVEQARTAIDTSIAEQQAGVQAGAAMPVALVEAQLLAAEMELKTGSAEKAAALFDPLLPIIQKDPPKELAAAAMRILVGAMEAAIARQDIARAESLMGELERQGGTDSARVTQVLVQLGRSLEQQLQQHRAAGREAEADQVRRSFESFLEKLAGRQQQTFASLQYLAESYFALGSHDKAADLFQRMVQMAKADPAFAQLKGSESELQRVQLRRVMALRLIGQHATALGEVDALLKSNPRLLAAIMERGRVLQDWGDKDSAKALDAAKHWDQTSRKLQSIAPRPAEYFEARYGLAYCLAKLGRKQDALRVLQSTLALSPSAGGPEIKRQYESLLMELDPASGAAASNSGANR